MAGLTPSQLQVITTLIATAPDSAIRSLDLALSSAGGDGPMGEIRDMVGAEATERRTRRLTFAPLNALCQATDASPRKTFPRDTPAQVWAAMKREDPDRVSLAIANTLQWTDDDDIAAVFDALCRSAARGLRDPAGTGYEIAARRLESARPGAAAEFADYLALTPLSRGCIAKLPDWIGRMTEERAAAVRLAYRDATAIAVDAGPKLLEILAAQLDEPCQILRLIATIHDKPTDAFLQGSELRELCERLLDGVDRNVDAFSTFDPLGGADAGYAAAENLAQAISEIGEFEQGVELRRDGPWGVRIAKQKAILTQKIELYLKRVDDAVGMALPVKAPRYGKGLRGIPVFAEDPNLSFVLKAEALAALLERSRASAQAGGFATLRAKVTEKLDDRLDHYVDDVLDHLRGENPEEPKRASDYLEVAARLIGLYRDEKAAQIVRRRAAA